MHNLYKWVCKLFVVLFISLLLAACSRVTQENFNKIKPNMTLTEVVAILGEPTTSESINIAGVSGTSTVWKDKNSEIDIQFLNDKLIAKSFNKSPEVESQKP